MVKRSRKPHYKDTKSTKRRKKKKQHGFVDASTIHESWDNRKTLKQNFEAMGLALDANKAVESKTMSNKVIPEVMKVQRIVKIEPYRVKSMSVKEQQKLIKLRKKYGDDYNAMSKDFKINVKQETADQLRRRFSIFDSIQAATASSTSNEKKEDKKKN